MISEATTAQQAFASLPDVPPNMRQVHRTMWILRMEPRRQAGVSLIVATGARQPRAELDEDVGVDPQHADAHALRGAHLAPRAASCPDEPADVRRCNSDAEQAAKRAVATAPEPSFARGQLAGIVSSVTIVSPFPLRGRRRSPARPQARTSPSAASTRSTARQQSSYELYSGAGASRITSGSRQSQTMPRATSAVKHRAAAAGAR